MTKTGIVFLSLLAVWAGAETLRLGPDGQWQNLSNDPQGQYILALSEIKQKIASGKKGEALAALEKLKLDFKEMAGPDLDDYIAAEKLYVKRDWSKSAKKLKEYVKKWPESPFFSLADERLFSIGTAFLQGQKRQVLWVIWVPAFDEGVTIMHDIADQMGASPMGLRALTVLAEAYEKKKKYPEAYEVWSEIADKWPTGDTGQNALLRMAQTLHAAYRGPEYDPLWLVSAKAYYEDFLLRYPPKAAEIGAEDKLSMIVEQQAYKNFMVGKYYSRSEHPLASNLYYDYVLSTWPSSKAAVMTAQAQKQTAPPKSFRRKMFDGTTWFFDNWFGIGLLFGTHKNQQ